MPKLLKYGLLVVLVALTLHSFRYASRMRGTPPQPSGWPMPYFAEQQPQPVVGLTGSWERYTHAGEEFSVELPGMPFAYESSRNVASSSETEPTRTFGLYSGGVIILITSFDNPREEEKAKSFAAYHWHDENELTYRRDVKAGDFWGEEYQSTGEYFKLSRVFRARNHAYLVCAMSQDAKDPRIVRFLESFTLGGKPSGREIDEPRQDAVKAPVKSAASKGDAVDGMGPGVGKPADLALAEPYQSSDVPLKAIVAFKPSTDYTEEARMHGVEGNVRLKAMLTADGKIGNVSVIRGLPYGLTEKAVDSARHVLFFPAIKDDRTVPVYVTLEYNFTIYGEL